MMIKDAIVEKLTTHFSPVDLEVIDESDKHRGHGGWREGGETHFRVRLVSDAFKGMNRVARHRAVNDALSEELSGRVHALAIEVRSTDEPDPRAARVSGIR